MDENVTLLNYIYQNAKMGTEAIQKILKSCNSPELCEHLKEELDGYTDICNCAEKSLEKLNVKPTDIPMAERFGLNFSVTLKTLVDKSPSHIADMLIQGSTEGIIDITRSINSSNCEDKDILNLANKLLTLEENNMKNLKRYL